MKPSPTPPSNRTVSSVKDKAVIALISILITGRYPAGLYRFAVGVLRWSTRVEAYVFLMRDEYPPFSLD